LDTGAGRSGRRRIGCRGQSPYSDVAADGWPNFQRGRAIAIAATVPQQYYRDFVAPDSGIELILWPDSGANVCPIPWRYVDFADVSHERRTVVAGFYQFPRDCTLACPHGVVLGWSEPN
jgi:hypothetical protein